MIIEMELDSSQLSMTNIDWSLKSSGNTDILKLRSEVIPNSTPCPENVKFRRASTINTLAPSKLQTTYNSPISDIRSYFDNRTAVFQCRKRGCLTCQFILHGRSTNTDNKGNIFHIKQFITCSMEFVIDVLRCLCNRLYIRHTTRTMQKCIGEHRKFIQKGSDEHSIPHHFLQAHKKDIRCLEVMAITAIPKGTLMKDFPSFARGKLFGSLNLDLCPLMASTRILKCIW